MRRPRRTVQTRTGLGCRAEPTLIKRHEMRGLDAIKALSCRQCLWHAFGHGNKFHSWRCAARFVGRSVNGEEAELGFCDEQDA